MELSVPKHGIRCGSMRKPPGADLARKRAPAVLASIRRECHIGPENGGAVILVDQHLLAEYAVAHYLEQPRVKDAYIDGTEL